MGIGCMGGVGWCRVVVGWVRMVGCMMVGWGGRCGGVVWSGCIGVWVGWIGWWGRVDRDRGGGCRSGGVGRGSR